MSLFESPQESLTRTPLPHKVRPKKLEDFHGQEAIFKRYPFLKGKEIPGLILWGPPGSGKTTLAEILANTTESTLFSFNAVLGGVADLKKLIKEAKESQQFYGKKAIIFVDEIHRFNKAQQDALLPYVEKGEFNFIGATTENPKVSVNKALLSRVQVVHLQKISQSAMSSILERATQLENKEIDPRHLERIAEAADGDARFALNTLDSLWLQGKTITDELIDEILSGGNRSYDKDKDRHYDVISGFIKSMRGSDPSAALLYLAIMIDGGEDPVFIARRLVIFASEDVGNADPQALTLAVSGLQAVQQIGMPEARINLAQVTTYLASTVKSNAAYTGLDEALAYVRSRPTIEVPTHLRNHHPDNKNYKYPHSYPNHYVSQQYAPSETPKFYEPTDQGTEKRIADRLKSLK